MSWTKLGETYNVLQFMKRKTKVNKNIGRY